MVPESTMLRTSISCIDAILIVLLLDECFSDEYDTPKVLWTVARATPSVQLGGVLFPSRRRSSSRRFSKSERLAHSNLAEVAAQAMLAPTRYIQLRTGSNMFGIGKRIRFVNYPNVDPSKGRGINIVGESFYQRNIVRMSEHANRTDQWAWVSLRAEPKNPHDRNAIRVDWVNPEDASVQTTIGYIPSSDTSKWHPIIATAPKGSAWVWPAQVTGGGPGLTYGVIFHASK